MKDRELLKFVREFRRGILRGASAHRMCFAVCAPLEILLNLHGVAARLVEVDFPFMDHVFLKLPDGRILDPTANQFNDQGCKFPPIYLGPMPLAFETWMAEARSELETPNA